MQVISWHVTSSLWGVRRAAVAGTAGRGAHCGDAVVDVEGEAVHHHVVELHTPAHMQIHHTAAVAGELSEAPWHNNGLELAPLLALSWSGGCLRQICHAAPDAVAKAVEARRESGEAQHIGHDADDDARDARLGRQPDLVQELAARVVHAARRHVGQHLNSRRKRVTTAQINRGPVTQFPGFTKAALRVCMLHFPRELCSCSKRLPPKTRSAHM